jgi:hypothetical protein
MKFLVIPAIIMGVIVVVILLVGTLLIIQGLNYDECQPHQTYGPSDLPVDCIKQEATK